jgi:hypothetical protein
VLVLAAVGAAVVVPRLVDRGYVSPVSVAPRDPAERAAAERLLAALPVPAGAERDAHVAADGDTTGSQAYAAADVSPGPGAPPGEWSALGVQPAAWPGTVRRAEGVDGGCAAYRGTLTVPATQDEAVAALRASLVRAGHHVQEMSCAHDAGTCVLGAVRFRSAATR